MTAQPALGSRAALWLAALAPLLLWFAFQLQRPFPFTTTNDNWGYFLPLMTKTTTAWLDGHSLRVLWDLGQGWSPWESGQVGWLSPLPVVAALIARLAGDPLLLLEVDAALHLLVLGLVAVVIPPGRFSGWSRVALALGLGLAPGPILVGMNWHDYLTPAPWFLLLLGMVWRAVDDDRTWTARESVVVVVVSLLFFSAAHPQMVVLGHGFLTLFALTCAQRWRRGVDIVVKLAIAQLGVVPPLLYLMLAAADGSPVWRQVRDTASLLTGVLPPVQGLFAVGVGPWAATTAAAFFNPLLLVLVVVGVVKRRPGIAAAAALMLVLLLPTLLPAIEHIFVGGLASFRFPVKLACYVSPLAVALWFVLHVRFREVVAVIAAAAGVVVCLVGNDTGTTFNSAHMLGAGKLAALGKSCLDDVGVAAGERIAFIGDLKHSRSFDLTPIALMAMANNAPRVFGHSSAHLYEPLESEGFSNAHGGLTAFWRGSPLAMSDEPRLELLRRSGTTWLLALTREELGPLPAAFVCDVWFARLPAARAFPGPRNDVTIDSAGVLTTTKAQPAAPALDTARPLTWQALDDGRWQAVPPLPQRKWWVATVGALLLSLLLLRRLGTRGSAA